MKLLYTNERNEKLIESQKKEIERLNKQLSETQSQLSSLQAQVKEVFETENRLASLMESLKKRFPESEHSRLNTYFDNKTWAPGGLAGGDVAPAGKNWLSKLAGLVRTPAAVDGRNDNKQPTGAAGKMITNF